MYIQNIHDKAAIAKPLVTHCNAKGDVNGWKLTKPGLPDNGKYNVVRWINIYSVPHDWTCIRMANTSRSIYFLLKPEYGPITFLPRISRDWIAVGQVVACAPVTQRARVGSPVGTSFLGEVFFGDFPSSVRQMLGSFRPQGPRISFGHHYHL